MNSLVDKLEKYPQFLILQLCDGPLRAINADGKHRRCESHCPERFLSENTAPARRVAGFRWLCRLRRVPICIPVPAASRRTAHFQVRRIGGVTAQLSDPTLCLIFVFVLMGEKKGRGDGRGIFDLLSSQHSSEKQEAEPAARVYFLTLGERGAVRIGTRVDRGFVVL